MNTINATEYGQLTMGKGYCVFTNANTLRDAVIIWVKRIMRMPENEPVFKTNGKNDYKAVVIENAENDGQEGITGVCLEETADHIINTFGFLCENRKSIAPHIILPELLNLFERWGIQE